MTRASIFQCAAIAALAVAAACSSTSLKDSWKDPAYAGPKFQQVLVLGASKSDSTRRIFEDGFAAALRNAGTTAAPSYPVLSVSNSLSYSQLADAMAKAGSDSALVTQVLRVRKDVSVTPAYGGPGYYGRGFGGWYGGAWTTGPDIDVYEVLTIESTLWTAKADRPVWTGTSEVTEPKSVAKATEELAKVLVGKLKADGMI